MWSSSERHPPQGVLDVGGWPPVGVRGLARSASWTALVPGAILVTFGFQGTHGLVVYLLGPKLETSTSLYGALGVVATVLFFMWVVGRIVVSAPILNRPLHGELSETWATGASRCSLAQRSAE